MLTTADLAILRYLARRGRGTFSQIAANCAMPKAGVGMHLVTLEFLQFVTSQQDSGGEMRERTYCVTQDGRRQTAASRA